jgi:hypothetical protein
MSAVTIGPRFRQYQPGKSEILSDIYTAPIPHDYFLFGERVVVKRSGYTSLYKITFIRSARLSPGIGTRRTFRCAVQGGSI